MYSSLSTLSVKSLGWNTLMLNYHFLCVLGARRKHIHMNLNPTAHWGKHEILNGVERTELQETTRKSWKQIKVDLSNSHSPTHIITKDKLNSNTLLLHTTLFLQLRYVQHSLWRIGRNAMKPLARHNNNTWIIFDENIWKDEKYPLHRHLQNTPHPLLKHHKRLYLWFLWTTWGGLSTQSTQEKLSTQMEFQDVYWKPVVIN